MNPSRNNLLGFLRESDKTVEIRASELQLSPSELRLLAFNALSLMEVDTKKSLGRSLGKSLSTYTGLPEESVLSEWKKQNIVLINNKKDMLVSFWLDKCIVRVQTRKGFIGSFGDALIARQGLGSQRYDQPFQTALQLTGQNKLEARPQSSGRLTSSKRLIAKTTLFAPEPSPNANNKSLEAYRNRVRTYMSLEAAIDLAADFTLVNDHLDTPFTIYDSSLLPFDKESLMQAFYNGLRHSPTEHVFTCFYALVADICAYQRGLGERPLNAAGMDRELCHRIVNETPFGKIGEALDAHYDFDEGKFTRFSALCRADYDLLLEGYETLKDPWFL